jgi:hypothetical protein
MATTKRPTKTTKVQKTKTGVSAAEARTSARTALSVPAPQGLPTASVRTAGSVARTAATAAMRSATSIAAPAAALNTNLTNELNNIDFRKMIGGPLQAAVDAQVASSLATVNFIKEVGFTHPVDPNATPELVMVDFSHTRTDVDVDGNPVPKIINVRVPLLAMLPVPSLRIEHVIIDFNAKLNSVESSQVANTIDASTEVKAGWGPVNFKVSASFQRKTTTNVEVKKEYSIQVNVKAVQDELPAGLEKIFGLLAA